jgi:hypothetical protein
VPDEINLYGEITPGYAVIGEAAFRKIRELFGNIRIIFLMRDPVERFYSHTRMKRNKHAKTSKPALEIASLIDNPRFTELSAYEHTIRDLEAVFSRNSIIYLFYETLFCDATISKLCDLVGMEYRPANFATIANGGGKQDPVPPSVHERFVKKFQSTYSFCRDKFGAELPEQWHKSAKD